MREREIVFSEFIFFPANFVSLSFVQHNLNQLYHRKSYFNLIRIKFFFFIPFHIHIEPFIDFNSIQLNLLLIEQQLISFFFFSIFLLLKNDDDFSTTKITSTYTHTHVIRINNLPLLIYFYYRLKSNLSNTHHSSIVMNGKQKSSLNDH